MQSHTSRSPASNHAPMSDAPSAVINALVGHSASHAARLDDHAAQLDDHEDRLAALEHKQDSAGEPAGEVVTDQLTGHESMHEGGTS